MKIILLHDVPNVGKKYQVKNVADGYGLNALIPQGLATTATAVAVKKIELLKKQLEVEEKIKLDLLQKNFDSLQEQIIQLEVPANEKGHLFSGIHVQEILKILHEQKHLDLPPSCIVLEKPIKQTGEHKIEIAIGEKRGAFTLAIKGK